MGVTELGGLNEGWGGMGGDGGGGGEGWNGRTVGGGIEMWGNGGHNVG